MPQDPEATAPRPALPMRLTRLRVKNFRSIADIDIPLSPLTVLVGPNGSGKSNVVDALRFVRDVFARGLDQAVMDREGMGVIQRWGTEGIEIGVTVELAESIVKLNDYGGTIVPRIPNPIKARVDYDFLLSKNRNNEPVLVKEVLDFSSFNDHAVQVVIVKEDGVAKGKFGYEKRMYRLDAGDRFSLPNNDFNAWPLPMQASELSKRIFKITRGDLLDDSYSYWSWYNFGDIVKECSLILASNRVYSLNPSELRQPQHLLRETPFEENGRNLAAVIRRIFRKNSSEWNDLRLALRRAVSGFDTLEIESVGGYLATKFIYQTDTTEPRTSYIGQESDGTIRMLGLLAALYQDPAQPFLSIEEPEANIHPGALAVLASVLDEASLRSQILVTTHSPDMLDHLPAESFLVVEKVGDTTHVGPLDASQLASVRKRLFTPGELLRMEGLQRQTGPEEAAS